MRANKVTELENKTFPDRNCILFMMLTGFGFTFCAFHELSSVIFKRPGSELGESSIRKNISGCNALTNRFQLSLSITSSFSSSSNHNLPQSSQSCQTLKVLSLTLLSFSWHFSTTKIYQPTATPSPHQPRSTGNFQTSLLISPLSWSH